VAVCTADRDETGGDFGSDIYQNIGEVMSSDNSVQHHHHHHHYHYYHQQDEQPQQQLVSKVKVKVKVKIKFVKRHKTTHNVQIQRR